jgi:hypothetical protein
MRWIIVKHWKGLPETAQQATRQIFTDQVEAERVKAELARDMPGRVFALQELPERDEL